MFRNASRGDARALAEIDRLVRSFARHVCRGGGPSGSPDLDWEDVAQEAMRKLVDVGIRQYSGKGSERSYLYSIVKATVIGMCRSASRRQRRELAVAPNPKVEAPEPGARFDVRKILGALSNDCRVVIERLFFDESSHAEVAGELGLAESSVRARLSRCLRKAREFASEGRGR